MFMLKRQNKHLATSSTTKLGEKFDFSFSNLQALQPVTFALMYVGTTLKDLSDVTHGWGEVSTTRWVTEAIRIGAREIKENSTSVVEVQRCLEELDESIATQKEVDNVLVKAHKFCKVEFDVMHLDYRACTRSHIND